MCVLDGLCVSLAVDDHYLCIFWNIPVAYNLIRT